MPRGYIALRTYSQRSFLFYVVAKVGPRGSTRPLAVAYRQGNDVRRPGSERIKNLVTDILSLVKVLSDTANRASLVAELALATNWYHQRQGADTEVRPAALPDSTQPPFRGGYGDEWEPIWQPELPQNDAHRQFPFTCAYLLSGLLRGNESTRAGDVQLQPLSTPFYGNCLEYGMVVVDISNLENVKYGIVAFPVRYMADVIHYLDGEWDPVEDDPPQKEPDIVLVEERPRVPFSILAYLGKYFLWPRDNPDPKFLELDACPHIDDPSVLDYIWPSYLDESSKQPRPSKCTAM